MKKAIFPGSFDPLHQGHISILEKALKIFDRIIVLVAISDEKQNGQNLEQRFLDTFYALKNFENVEVDKLESGLVSDYAKEKKINFLIRSIRDIKDLEYEFKSAFFNKKNNPNLETILIIPNETNLTIRSSQFKK